MGALILLTSLYLTYQARRFLRDSNEEMKMLPRRIM